LEEAMYQFCSYFQAKS